MSIKNLNIPARKPSYKRQSNLQKKSEVRASGNRQEKSPIRQQQQSMLIQTCCPNCRYRFQVVDQQKLQKIRTSIQELQKGMNPGKQEVVINKKWEVPQMKKRQYNNTDINISIRKQENSGKEEDSINEKGNKNIMKGDKEGFKGDNKINRLFQINAQKEDALIDEGKKYAYNQNTFQIDSTKLSKIRQKRNNFDLSLSDIQNDGQMCQLIGKIGKISQIHSPKVTHFEPICKYCGCDKIPSSTIMLAAKSTLATTQLQMMSNYVQMNPDTPGYIKFLRIG